MATGYQGIIGTLSIPSASNTSSVLLNSDDLDKFSSMTLYVSGNALGTLTLQSVWTGSESHRTGSWHNVYVPSVSGLSAVSLIGGSAIQIPTIASEGYRFSGSVAQPAVVNIVIFGSHNVDIKALP
jgi:hypothetical protein